MGGLEVVSSVLANKFVQEGHNVSIFAFTKAEHSIKNRLDKRIHTYIIKEFKYNKENVHAMRAVMLEEKINIVINQWGLPFVPIKVAIKASMGLDVKIISVYHNNPSFNGRIQYAQIFIDNAKNPIKKVFGAMKKKIFKEITACSMRYNYRYSDKYMVLSSRFIDEFKKFTRIKHPEHLIVLPNPVTINYSDYIYSRETKRKEIIYVGRLDYMQKRVYRIIDTWKLLEGNYNDWQLTIVGVGEETDSLKKQVHSYGLKHVSFEGFQPPKEYYKRASILMLTSDFEGFPLVLAEAMSFGVVPVVYDSFSSVRDIIVDGVNGVIVSNVNRKFDAIEMAKSITSLMNDSVKLKDMSIAAQKKSKDFSLETIYMQWLDVFNNILM